jgi:hypothetical protein
MRLDFSNAKLPYYSLATVITKPGDPVSYAVVCNAPIDEASACIPLWDAPVTMSTSFSEDRKTFYFTWRTPYRGAIWVLVFSREEIHIRAITPIC